MRYLVDFRDELITLIGTVWPEVTANGIYRTRELVRQDFERKVNAGEVPLVVLDVDPTPWQDGPLSARIDLCRTSIYYVTDDSLDGDALLEKLEDLRSELWKDDRSEPLETGQVIEQPTVSDSAELVVNRYFLMRGWQVYAGAVMANILVGDNP